MPSTATHIKANAKAALPSWDRIAGNWKQMSGAITERWGELTDDDLSVIDGQHERLIGKIQERYGIIRDQAEVQVAEWLKGMESASGR
ncbi:CsbD family protein [Ferrovibrio sp.]|uniref:CsbD family protein n=1 Tax=Ferrovibrio sp. TaxID=1917215 RepID=UPI00311D335E